MRFWSRHTKQADGSPKPAEEVKAGSPAEDVVANGERFCAAHLLMFPAGQGRHLVYNVSDRSALFLTTELATLLAQCQTFKTLRQHAEAGAPVFELGPRGMKGAYLKSVAEQFSHLVERGLLISERELLARCARAAERAESPRPISTVGFVTRDRPESLRRAVESYAENAGANGREVGFVVCDDTADAEARRQTREMLRGLGRRYGVSVRYAGAEEKRRYAQALATGGGLPREVVEFALFDPEGYGYTPGANRNALMLETAGEMFFSTDDDAVCRLAAAPGAEAGGGAPGHAEPMGLWFFPDRETALREEAFFDEDFLASHERLLGRDVATCVNASGGLDVLDIERVAPRDLLAIQSGAGKVLVTLNGMLGDSGLRSPAIFRVLGRKSRERLIESEDGYFASRFSREILRVAERTCISRRAWFLSTALAYDNRQILPPFLPVARGEDGVFADTLRVCFEDGFLATLPRAVLHLPPQARFHSPEQVRETASSLPAAHIISACVQPFRTRQGTPDGPERLAALGQQLIDIGSMALEDFEEFVRMHVWQLQSRYISELEGEVQGYEDPPDFWAEDVEEYLETMRATLKRPEYIIPHDARTGLGRDEARLAVRRLVSKFGELLRAWPGLVERAKEMRAKGQSLAVAV